MDHDLLSSTAGGKAASLAGRSTILIASTGWGKMTAFFVPILVLQHLIKLCVLSALSSETVGLNLSYGEVIRSCTDLCMQKSYFSRSSVSLDGQYRCC